MFGEFFKLKAFKIDNFQICNVVKRLDLPLKIDLELSYTGTFFVVYIYVLKNIIFSFNPKSCPKKLSQNKEFEEVSKTLTGFKAEHSTQPNQG